MKIKAKVHDFRSQIIDEDKFAIVKFEKNTQLDLRFGISDDKIFRLWDVVDPKANRNLRVDKDFNLYRDSIYDYPIIAMNKLGKNSWEQFNKSMMIQIGACTDFVCWHCYLERGHIKGDKKILEYVTPKDLVNRYLDERKRYYDKNIIKGFGVDLFRIHGGEPLLAPDLIYEVLCELKERKLDNDIFVWSETNLAPLYSINNEKSFIDDIGFDLKKLAQFKNFGLHPCFHGISDEDFKRNTALDDFEFQGFLDAYKKLLDAGVDIYPTFGSNVNKVKNLVKFFNQIKEINRDSLKRIALIEYKIYYNTVVERFKCWDDLNKNMNNKLDYVLELFQINNEKNNLLSLWNELLANEFGESYLETERARVKL